MTDVASSSKHSSYSAIVLGIAFALGYAFYTLSIPLIADNASEVSLFQLAGIVVGGFCFSSSRCTADWVRHPSIRKITQ